MIKRELKVNFKSFIIWLSLLILMFLVVFLVYPYIVTDDTIKSLDEMIKVFPPELLKTFNMDLASINTAYGWLKSEGFMFVLIIISMYASILGFNILLKEEYNMTAQYLSFLPIKRSKIVTSKILVSIIYIFLITIILGIFNYIALSLSGDFNHLEYFLLSITPIIVALPLFSFNLFLSSFVHKSKKSIVISMGMVFIFYFLNIISELSNKVSFFKYFTVYTLADTRNIIINTKINGLYILISLIFTIIFIIGTYLRYEKKELL